MNNELLNQVASLLNTTDKNLVISFTIKSLIDEGMSVNEAIDAVFGNGSHEKMVGQIFDALQIA